MRRIRTLPPFVLLRQPQWWRISTGRTSASARHRVFSTVRLMRTFLSSFSSIGTFRIGAGLIESYDRWCRALKKENRSPIHRLSMIGESAKKKANKRTEDTKHEPANARGKKDREQALGLSRDTNKSLGCCRNLAAKRYIEK